MNKTLKNRLNCSSKSILIKNIYVTGIDKKRFVVALNLICTIKLL